MKPTNDIVACVIDHGLFLPVALKLAETFKQTYYWTPVERDFPTIKEGIIGDGFARLTRTESPWEVKDQCDLFVFPDIGFAAMQEELVSQGYPVWGGRRADSLEKNRGKFLREISRMGMPVPKYERILGLTNLRLHLADLEDKWIKISKWRGDVETFHWRSWAEDEATLDNYACVLGPAKELITFYVIDPVETDIEDGVDTFCIQGRLPRTCLHAMECKDKALIGTVVPFSALPENLRQISQAFAVVLKEYDYRQFFSTEVRVAEDECYFIDPTLRAGSPPSQLQTELFANLAEIVWAGANGECVDPVGTAEFGVQARLTTKEARTNWFAAEFAPELSQWVKCHNCCEIDGRTCFPPDRANGRELGWLVATGDSISSAIAQIKNLASKLPDNVCCDTGSLADLLVEVDEAESAGMEFTDKTVPQPQEVFK